MTLRALLLAAGILVAVAAPAQASSVTLGAPDAAGLLAGERVVVTGTVDPPGPVTVSAAIDGSPLPDRAATVDGAGAFSAGVHPRVPGQLQITAHVPDGAASPPLTLTVGLAGRVAPGCDGPATLVGLDLAHPPTYEGTPLRRGALLDPDARIAVAAHVRLRRGSAIYRLSRGRLTIECRAVGLTRGEVRARGRAQVVLGPALGRVGGDGARLEVSARPRRMRFVGGHGFVTSSANPVSAVRTIAGDTVLIGGDGLPRMDTWPFARAPDQRRLKRSAVPPYWADGSACATGCRPPGALTGWPLRPFGAAHPLRSGLNEWRPANMHIGIDIQALDGTRVYAIQSGRASIAGVGTVDIRVAVGSYEYWHVRPAVGAGAVVRAHRTVIGHIIRGAGHLHLSEVHGGYVNPLRPGGRVLAPYHDTEEPVIGAVRRTAGTVDVEAFDPQSLRETIKYRTPVLAPSAVAWRARDARGRALTPLVFAYRGAHHYPAGAKSLVYGPGTTPPFHTGAIAGGWACFWSWKVCVPKWNYRLPGVPAGTAAVSVYAWDWAGNVAVRTSRLRAGRAAAPPPRASVSRVD